MTWPISSTVRTGGESGLHCIRQCDGLHRVHIPGVVRSHIGVEPQRDSRGRRRNLFENFKPLCTDPELKLGEACHVPAGTGQARYELAGQGSRIDTKTIGSERVTCCRAATMCVA
jgi:hypothetical protein